MTDATEEWEIRFPIRRKPDPDTDMVWYEVALPFGYRAVLHVLNSDADCYAVVRRHKSPPKGLV